MSEYDCRAGSGTHAHGRESSADAADSSFDLSVFAKDSLRMLLRLFWLPLLLAVVFSALFCYNAKRSYRPMYKASATFTVNVVGMSGASASYYSKSTAEQFARTFPYILTSGFLRSGRMASGELVVYTRRCSAPCVYPGPRLAALLSYFAG